MSAEGRAAREDRERSWGYFGWGVCANWLLPRDEDEAKKERKKGKKQIQMKPTSVRGA
jgi:hypothetical protein